MLVCGEGLRQNFGLEKSLTCGLLSFDSPEGSFQTFCELLTRFSCHPFDPLFDPTVRSDGEAERALGHTRVVLWHAC